MPSGYMTVSLILSTENKIGLFMNFVKSCRFSRIYREYRFRMAARRLYGLTGLTEIATGCYLLIVFEIMIDWRQKRFRFKDNMYTDRQVNAKWKRQIKIALNANMNKYTFSPLNIWIFIWAYFLYDFKWHWKNAYW